MQGSWVQFLVGKLRSHMPCSMTKNKQLKNDQSLTVSHRPPAPLDMDPLVFKARCWEQGWGWWGGGGSGRVSGVFIFSVQSFLQGASSALITFILCGCCTGRGDF